MKVRPTHKGRRVDPQALKEVRSLLGDAPRRGRANRARSATGS